MHCRQKDSTQEDSREEACLPGCQLPLQQGLKARLGMRAEAPQWKAKSRKLFVQQVLREQEWEHWGELSVWERSFQQLRGTGRATIHRMISSPSDGDSALQLSLRKPTAWCANGPNEQGVWDLAHRTMHTCPKARHRGG